MVIEQILNSIITVHSLTHIMKYMLLNCLKMLLNAILNITKIRLFMISLFYDFTNFSFIEYIKLKYIDSL